MKRNDRPPRGSPGAREKGSRAVISSPESSLEMCQKFGALGGHFLNHVMIQPRHREMLICTRAASLPIPRGTRALICDRDRKWTLSVRQLVAGSGIRSVQTPFQAPHANAYAERFVRSIKDECQARDSFGGTPPATDDRGVRRPLSPGAKASGPRQRTHRPCISHAWHRLYSSPLTTWRTPQLLLSRGMTAS